MIFTFMVAYGSDKKKENNNYKGRNNLGMLVGGKNVHSILWYSD